jgi:hypothetical protein
MSMTTERPPESPQETNLNITLLPACVPALKPRQVSGALAENAQKTPFTLKPIARRLLRMAGLVAVGFTPIWMLPELRLLAFLLCGLVMPVLALATVGGFFYDARQAFSGRALRGSQGLKYGLCTGLCFIAAIAFLPPITMSPIMLDLNNHGVIGTTGTSTAKARLDGHIGRTVEFDLAGNGQPRQIEWSNADGAGFLVDDRDHGISAAARVGGHIDGSRLFGDQGGRYTSGYDKLATLDRNGDGKLTGSELVGLSVWVDNGDARLQPGELKSVSDWGITSIDVSHHAETNTRGETLDRAGFTQNGQRKMTEDVWFARR